MSNPKIRHVVAGGLTAVAIVALLAVFAALRRPATDTPAREEAPLSRQDVSDAAHRAALSRERAQPGDTGAVPGLIDGLRKNSDPSVRAACAEALGRIGDKRSMPDLAMRLAVETDPSVRRSVAAAMEACGMQREAGFFKTLKKRLADDNAPEVRREIAGILARTATDDAMKALAAAIEDRDAGVRLAVVRAFADSSNEARGRILAGATMDPDATVRKEAVDAMNRAGSAFLPQLRSAVANARDADALMAAVQSLPRPVAADCVPILLSALEKQSAEEAKSKPQLRDAVVDALAGMGSGGAEVIAREAIQEDYAGVAEAAAARACLRIGKPAARPITDQIMRWKIFPDPAELKMWIETLGELGDPCAVPALRRALAQGLDDMPAVVQKARVSIEAKSGARIPELMPEPGLLADAPAGPIRRLREGDMRYARASPSMKTDPTNGVMRLRLAGGMVAGDAPGIGGRVDLEAEFVRRDGVWDKRFPVTARNFNKRDHEGILLEVRETGANRTFVFDVLCYDDTWRKTAFGHFEVTQPTSPPSFSGTYAGHMNFRPLRGAVEGWACELPPHPPALPPFAPGEHPRLIFRESDIPMLREKARTEFGRRVFESLRRWMAANKTLYRTRLEWVSNWESGCDLALIQGLLALLFDDPLYGRRSAPLIIDRTRTPPYGGEHGERMPGPMSHYPYAVDMNFRYFTADERKEIVESRCWLPSLYTQAQGPLSVMAANRTIFGIPGLAALTVLREKGTFFLREPEPAPSVIALPAEAGLETGSEADPVNLFLAGTMPSNWLVAGPFPVEPDADPLAAIGGCAAARPRLDTAVPVKGGERKFRPLSPTAIRTRPPPFPRMQSVDLPAKADEQFFLYAVIRVGSRQGVLVDPASRVGLLWAGIWIDGRAISGSTVAALEPGLHRVLVCVRSPFCSPVFHAADADWALARQRRYELLKQRWDAAKARHAETGEVEDVAVIFDPIRDSVRSALWYERGVVAAGKRSGGAMTLNNSFVLACRAATGMGLDPDNPRPVLMPGETLADSGGSLDMVAKDPDLIYMLGLAPEEILGEVVYEFDRRITPERLAQFSPREQIIAFVNYPMDVKKRPPSTKAVPDGVTAAVHGMDAPASRAAEDGHGARTGTVVVAMDRLEATARGDPGTVGFRNDGSGHYQGKVVDKFDLATGVNIRWKVPLPDYGVSSPIVVRPDPPGTNGDLVIVTCDPDRVIAYRLADGKEVWNRGIGVSPVLKPAHEAALRELGKWSGALPSYPGHIIPQVRMVNEKDVDTDWLPAPALGWSVATPVSDGSNVWAVGYRGAVGCIGINGELRWKVFLSRPGNVGERSAWGDWLPDTFRGSPRLVDGNLIATSVKTVFALDPATGTNHWRTGMPPNPGKSGAQPHRGATPAIWRHQDRNILVWGQGFAMDAKDGANVSGIWPELINNAPCLVIGNRMIARYSRGRRGDAPPPDGEPPTPWQLLAWDMSLVDGKLNLKRAWSCPPDDRFMQNSLNGDVTAGLTRIGDIVVACVLDEGGSAKGLLLAKVTDGTAQDPGCSVAGSSHVSFWQPSPAVAGDRMVVADTDGTITIVDIAQLPWKILSRTSVATAENRGKTGFVMGASPCIAGDALLIRTSRELLCIGPK